MTSRRALAVGGLVFLAVTGCSADAPSRRTTESPTARETASQNTATPGGATTAGGGATPGGVTPASSCLSGRYRLARFVAIGGTTTYGTGEAGDVTVAFGSGTYQMKGAGKKPITVTLAGQRASLLVAGTITGAYQAQVDTADFTVKKASGSATLTAGRQSRTLTMDDVGNVVGLTGHAKLACRLSLLVVTLNHVRLELEKL
jgi:hypothetical protein